MVPSPMDHHIDDENLLAFGSGTVASDTWLEIDAHVRGCPSCRERLEALVGAVAPTLAPKPGSGAAPPSLPPTGALPRGTCVGRYVLLEKLGAGGMGEVYVAYDPQLDRKVALKLLRSGVLGAEEGRARLLREAQAMARLAHPNIVAVHDAGTFEDRVFVAMELVEGTTLERWLREPRGWHEIVERFIAAGRGLSAAHAAGLVHRDFKPDNALVGDDGRVRVLDFGLARPAGSAEEAPRPLTGLDANLSGGVLHSPLTQAGLILGTPAYMAPEQIECTATDARTDQFSFCVALYEALYGRRPFAGETFIAILEAMDRPLPEPPRDGRVPAWIHRVLARGLSRRPDARFPSMDALLAELSRDPRGQRRRLLAAGAALALVAAVAGGSALQARHRRTVCQGASQQLAGIWDAPRQKAIHQAFLATGKPFAEDVWSRARAMLDDYTSAWVTMSADACEATRVRRQQSEEVLALRGGCLEGRLHAVKALTELFSQADADVMTNAVSAIQALQPLGECADAPTLAARAALEDPALRAKAARIRVTLIEAKALLDAGKYKRGTEIARQAVEAARALGYRSLEAEAWLQLARLQDLAEEPAGAEASFREAIWAAEAGRRDELSSRAWSRLVKLVGYTEKHPERGVELARFARAALERVGRNVELEADLENSQGALAQAQSNYEEALAHFRRALELRQGALGAGHPEVAWALNNVGAAEGRLGKHSEALAHYQQALDILEKVFGPNHPYVARQLLNLGITSSQLGHHPEALAYCQRALKIRERALEPDNPEIAAAVQALAQVYMRLGKKDEAISEYEHLLELHRAAWGPDSPQLAEDLTVLSTILTSQREIQKALPFLEQAVAILEKGDNEARLAGALDSLGAAYTAAGEYARAQEKLTRAQGLFEKAAPGSPGLARCLIHLGDLFSAQRQPARAVPVLERAVKLREADPNAPAELAQARFALAVALWDSKGSRARSLELATRAHEGYVAAGSRYHNELTRLEQWQAERAGGHPSGVRPAKDR